MKQTLINLSKSASTRTTGRVDVGLHGGPVLPDVNADYIAGIEGHPYNAATTESPHTVICGTKHAMNDADDEEDIEAEYGALGENGVEAAAEEDINTAPDRSDGVSLKKMDAVLLSEDKEAAFCYLEKAMAGFSCFLEDMSSDCSAYAAKQLNVKAYGPSYCLSFASVAAARTWCITVPG